VAKGLTVFHVASVSSGTVQSAATEANWGRTWEM